MRDKFADLEEPKSRTLIGALAILAIVGIFFAFRWSGSAATQVRGVVESSGSISVAKVSGGTREGASIRLENGNLVPAYVVNGGPLAPGDKVILLEEQRLLGGPVYQVVGKDLSH